MTDTPNPAAPVDAKVEQRHIELATRLNALCSGADWQLVANWERDRTADLERERDEWRQAHDHLAARLKGLASEKADLEKRLADAQRALVWMNDSADFDWPGISGSYSAAAREQLALARAAMAEKGEGNG